MWFWDRGVQAVRAEIRLLGAAGRDWRLLAALALFAALLLAAAHAPLRSKIEVGLEEGYGSDRPMVAQFHDPEVSTFAQANFRWTAGQSLIRLPGVGGRPLKLAIRLLPLDSSIAAQSPRSFELWANGVLLSSVAVRPTAGETFTFMLAPSTDGSADQVVEIRSATFTPPGDRRAIGLPVEQVRVESLGGLAAPDWRETLSWIGAAALLWLALRRIGLDSRVALALLLAALLLASLAALLDPVRFAFGATTALIACALGWLLALLLAAAPDALLLLALALFPAGLVALVAGVGQVGAALQGAGVAMALAGWLRPALAAGYRRVASPIPPAARRWLMLIALAILITHYGGKIYPDAMWGDIGFHSNRYEEVAHGLVLLLSRNRGVDFPYPPALYLLLAPFGLTGLDERVLLQLGGALLNAASPFVVYAIAVGMDEGRTIKDEKRSVSSSAFDYSAAGRDMPWRRGVLAAGIYSLAGATLMTTWWNFSTHIFTQLVHLVLMAALVLLWRQPAKTQRPKPKDQRLENEDQRLETATHLSSFILHPSSLVGLFVLQSLVYLGHFGFWMNMSLLGAFGLAVLLIAAWRGRAPWRAFRPLLAIYVAAELFAALFFYGAYAGLFIEQARATAAGGLTGMQNKQAVEISALWQSLWDAGLRVHFGFFPVPLALCGLVLLWRRATDDERPRTKDQGRKANGGRQSDTLVVGRWSLVTLVIGTFAVALLFGSLPFITRAALSTRWLMFSAWAIAVCAALAARRLWRSGRAGRWITLAMGAYIFWVTASMWLGALAYRIRPPEPF